MIFFKNLNVNLFMLYVLIVGLGTLGAFSIVPLSGMTL